MKDESNQYTHNIEALDAEMKRLDNLIEKLSRKADAAEKKKVALYKSIEKEQKSRNMWDIIIGSIFALFFIVIIYYSTVMN